MKILPYLTLLWGISAYASDYVIPIPRGLVSEADIKAYNNRYIRRVYNQNLNIKVINRLDELSRASVVGDPAAEKAMDLLLNCWHWLLVDHCEDALQEMTPPHQQLFREAIILLAPYFDIGNYTQRVIDLIGDPLSITPQYFQNKLLLNKMFCCAAGHSSLQGDGWSVTETYIAADFDLCILVANCDERKQMQKLNARTIAYGWDTCTDDSIASCATDVWPNLQWTGDDDTVSDDDTVFGDIQFDANTSVEELQEKFYKFLF
jgi:hypothetical protein